ncbi:MAG TPA: 30S ribosomal protein S5 [Rhodospirillaceae bacterium]|nr:30S ribosomal protein S5 [Rhodospirillaceae bacterium]
MARGAENQEGERKDGEREQRGRGRGRGRDGERGERGGNERGRDNDRERGEESDMIERLVGINRVAKVVKGGRRFAFAALVIVGDGKGRVGHGHGKAREVPEAIQKATQQARRNMIRVPLRDGRTLHHDVYGKHGAGKVFLRSAKQGTGIIAGGPMRAVFEAIGVQDVVAKALGSSNPYSMVNATFAALQNIQSPRHIASRRSKKVGEIVSSREVGKSQVEIDADAAAGE